MTTSTDETDQRHRYECDPCGIEGPLRNHRDRAARDAQQHDIGFHNGTITCELVAFEVATDGGRRGGRLIHDTDDLTYACPECDEAGNVYERASRGDPRGIVTDGYDCRCHDCGARFDREAVVERECKRHTGGRGGGQLSPAGQTLEQMDPDDLVTDGGTRMVKACPECDSTKFKARVSSVHKNLRTGDLDAKYKCGGCGATFDDPVVREAHRGHGLRGTARLLEDTDPEDILTDGGLERPPFVDPDVEVVECYFCHETWEPEAVDGFDLSDEDEYYPRMVPVCPEHAAGGCR
jgi:hypothetical protein